MSDSQNLNKIGDLLADLNEQQIDAVTSSACNMLIFAGAGSGKTRVLVSRIIYLMVVNGIYPSSIFAVTFTNKAANEMKSRIYKYADNLNINSMWIGTFHGLCNKFLRLYYQAANLPKDFTIIDPTDQLNIVKRVLKEHVYEQINIKPKEFLEYIDKRKELGSRPLPDADFKDSDYNHRLMNSVYRQYEELCRVSGSVDFTELILRTINVLESNDDIRLSVNRSFKEILVDEFQDTNNLQMKLLTLLKGENSHITVVGDDDQSIYSWRGANLDNILNFKNLFDNVKIIKLEQNYRSTQNILNAANSIIEGNINRFAKSMWTNSGKGDYIKVFHAEDATVEAQFVVNKIIDICKDNNERYSDCAILYRNNFLSLNFETALRTNNINYAIIGGHKFYERQEIKDLIAYMRIMTNPYDDQAFLRIVNVPPRKVGNKTLATLYSIASERNMSLFNAAEYACNNNLVTPGTARGLRSFAMTIINAKEAIDNLPLDECIKVVISKTGLNDYYKEVEIKEKDVGHSRTSNLDELINNSAEFVFGDEAVHTGLEAISFYLQNISLSNDGDDDSNDNNSVKLLTIHGAKGLEFNNVFVIGFEEGLIPSLRGIENHRQLEEERRLCYVAITRAKKRCFITYAKSRMKYGIWERTAVSRFFEDLDPNSYQVVGYQECLGVDSNIKDQNNNIGSDKFKNIIGLPGRLQQFKIGMRISHDVFGEGVILKMDGFGNGVRAYINFEKYGEKCILPAFCKLKVLKG